MSSDTSMRDVPYKLPNIQLPVPLRSGPPTKEELQVYYPARFTWKQLKTFVNSGDLGLLKRDKALPTRYNKWSVGIKEKYGSMVNYLLNHRLQWGKADRLSLLKSAIDDDNYGSCDQSSTDTHKYFSCKTPPEYISIIQNDWPYSVPPEIEHTLIWTKYPIFHPDLIGESIKARVEQDGLWGFTGNLSPPPSPSNLPACLPALAEWNVSLDTMVKSEKGSPEEDALVLRAGEEISKFVKRRWVEDKWETAWFVNPPRLQSVPGIAHIHVFARQKV